jgi:tetratricopeptide (TPR) repeat protein
MNVMIKRVLFISILITGMQVTTTVWATGLELYNKGTEAEAEGEYKTAIDYYDQAIDYGDLSREDTADAYYARGLNYGRLKDRESAMNSYRDALTLNPKHVKALGSLCFQLTQIDQLDQALHNCNKSLEIDPDYAAGINIRAQIWENKGQHERAEKDYLKAIVLEPTNWALYFNLGNYYERRERKSDARRLYGEAYERAPTWGRKHPISAKKFREYGFMN